MKLEIWIEEDWNRWNSICKAKGRQLTEEQTIPMRDELIKQMHINRDFIGVFFVFTTLYGN